jgi:tyrosine-protein kinase Etk/Wzc
MTPRPSLIGTLAGSRLLRRRWPRRAGFALLAVVLALLSLYPERYRATMLLAPPDRSGDLGTIAQLGAMNGLIGSEYQPERLLAIARSPQVALGVIADLKLLYDPRFGRDPRQALRTLDRKTDIRTLRGGIVEIAATDRDPRLALALAAKLGLSAQARLRALSPSGAAMQVIQPAFLDPERQINPLPLGGLIAVLLLLVAVEFYTLSARIDARRSSRS